jgi:hypothetical protein
VPVLIRYGMTDVLVPPAHGEWLAANVPGCIVKVSDEGGHMGGEPEQEIAENARWLSAGIAPERSRTGVDYARFASAADTPSPMNTVPDA